ncbi:LPXTG cell wall anchor domain-containing protein [Listeria weihenstephanensis]|uniref:chitinase n=1 Tax=Listeria weihenstephanensis TaxID=1006155 RepID=A0A841ZAI8_9LIST|nr:glycosyl hydrolase family 18 protein [Listeria weihenstephanensis]MBC1501497.1 LPXTG cell wall anchor domain-containing protein [Listeria weihenstephanensis]
MKKRTKQIFGSLTAILLVLSIALSGILGIVNTPKVAAAEAKSPYRNVMYYGDWSITESEGKFYPKDIPADKLTHLNFAFMDFDSAGNLVFTDKDAAVSAAVGQKTAMGGILNALQDLRAANPNLKIGVSLGGWSKSGDFSEMAANDTARANFVQNVMKFVKYTNMDFVDVDWEYPNSPRDGDLLDNKEDEGTPNAGPADKANYVTLLQDLRTALDAQGETLDRTYELSVALPASQWTMSQGIDIEKVFEIIDFGNMMTYDMHGAWDSVTGHQTALYDNPNDPYANYGLSVDGVTKYLQSKGVPSEKIVIGAAFYTRGWNTVAEGTNTSLPGLFQAVERTNKNADGSTSNGANNEKPLVAGDGGTVGGIWSYRSIDTLKAVTPGLTEYWDDIAKAPYLYSKETGAFFTYDNVKSVTAKANYVKENNLGGVISWMQSQDKPTTSTKRDELTTAIKNGMFGAGNLAGNALPYQDLAVEMTVTPYTNDGTGYEITITNKEVANETSDVLKPIETAAETIKLPRLYIPIRDGEKLIAADDKAGVVKAANGYTVVDLASSDARLISQGESYTFRLKSNIAPTDLKTVTLAQRMTASGQELGQQLVYEGAEVPPKVEDIAAPSVPSNLRVAKVTSEEVVLNWDASKDNVAVAGYKVYRDGKEIATVTNPTYTDKQVKQGQSYSYTVKAFDAAGNVSKDSNKVTVKILVNKAPDKAPDKVENVSPVAEPSPNAPAKVEPNSSLPQTGDDFPLGLVLLGGLLAGTTAFYLRKK